MNKTFAKQVKMYLKYEKFIENYGKLCKNLITLLTFNSIFGHFQRFFLHFNQVFTSFSTLFRDFRSIFFTLYLFQSIFPRLSIIFNNIFCTTPFFQKSSMWRRHRRTQKFVKGGVKCKIPSIARTDFEKMVFLSPSKLHFSEVRFQILSARVKF